jgi:hypothetical protein
MTVEGGLWEPKDILGIGAGRPRDADRPGSKSGGPAIDVRLPDGTQLKVHVSQ